MLLEMSTEHKTCYISYFFSLINSPFPFTHSFNSSRISLRSLTLEDVTFTANLFSVSETCPCKHTNISHQSLLTVVNPGALLIRHMQLNTVTTTIFITPCSVTIIVTTTVIKQEKWLIDCIIYWQNDIHSLWFNISSSGMNYDYHGTRYKWLLTQSTVMVSGDCLISFM